MKKMRTAVIGCGAISDIYLKNMTDRFRGLEVVGCSALTPAHARDRAEKYGIRAMANDEVFSDGSIELVVILTPAPSHAGLIRQALLAGKHVYTEKVMALSSAEAAELAGLAGERGLYLGSAPDTFLGAAAQSARRALDENLIGEVTSFQICANRNIDALAGIFPFLRMPGGGIAYDYGVYYLTALVSLLGPVKSVFAVEKNRREIRVNPIPGMPDSGKEYRYPNESQAAAVLTLESGVTGTLALNGDSILRDQALFTICGTEGILRLSDPNRFGGRVSLVRMSRSEPTETEEIALSAGNPFEDNCRGLGPAEMACAIREHRVNRAGVEMAVHVLEVLDMMARSSASGFPETAETSCRRPEPFYGGWAAGFCDASGTVVGAGGLG